MSRIDEALRRASQPVHLNRSGSRPVDGALRLAEDLSIEQYSLELPPPPACVEAAVPVADDPKRMETSVQPVRVTTPLTIDGNGKLIAGKDRNTASLEQYRRLAAILHEAQAERGLKSVMVTSAVPREGKTLTAINLALTFSESYGRRVLLVDGDLRRPSIDKVLGLRNERGLSDAIREKPSKPVVVQVTPLLSVLSSGSVAENPQAGLSSARMRGLLDSFTTEFDWIIVDTPPIGLVSDAQILAPLLDAIVFVIRANSTAFSLVEKAIADLGREYIIGTVLNAVDEGTIAAKGYDGNYYRLE
jgi:capsular exopolysaccharide synthesis family protein